MLPDDPQLKPQYRMPRVFGALPGPRNVPRDKQHLENAQRNTILSVSARTDSDALEALLPPGCQLADDPVFTVSLNRMENIGWLAGRGYSMLIVAFRIARVGAGGRLVPGNFIPVLWEDMADPIVTGRDELGFSKLYADLPQPSVVGGKWSARASWQGFAFCDLEVEKLVDAPIPPPPAVGNYQYKFIPKTGALSEADVDYVAYAPPGVSQAGYMIPPAQRVLTGAGSFAFHSARWEDMPFQYPVINGLAALPIREFISASLTFAQASGPIGDPKAGALTAVEEG